LALSRLAALFNGQQRAKSGHKASAQESSLFSEEYLNLLHLED
jgi:hypothetical protein